MRLDRVVPVASLLLLLGACSETTETVRLLPDGKGTVQLVTGMDTAGRTALADAVGELYDIPAEQRDRLRLDPFDPAWIRFDAAATPGLSLTRIETTVAEGHRRTVVEGRFDGLAAAVEGGLLLGAGLRLEQEPPTETRAASWRLEIREGWGWIGNEDREEIGGRPLGDVRARLAPRLEGAWVERTIRFPSRVLATDGERADDGVTVRWRYALGALLAESRRRSWARFEDRDGLQLAGVRVEPDPIRLVRRLLLAPPKRPGADAPDR